MAPVFNVVEHVIPGQHIREYPNATKHSQEDALKLSVKQYVPSNTVDRVPHNAVTIVGLHGNGFPKVSGGLQFAGSPNPRAFSVPIRVGLNVAPGDLRTVLG